jgi:hypothetical protein
MKRHDTNHNGSESALGAFDDLPSDVVRCVLSHHGCLESPLTMLRLATVSHAFCDLVRPILCDWLKPLTTPLPRQQYQAMVLRSDGWPPLMHELAWVTGDWANLRQLKLDFAHLLDNQPPPLSAQDLSEMLFIVALAEHLQTVPVLIGRDKQARRDEYMRITKYEPFERFKVHFEGRLKPLPRRHDIMRYFYHW